MSSLAKNGKNARAQTAFKILVGLWWFAAISSVSNCHKYEDADAVSILKDYGNKESVSEREVIWAIEKVTKETDPQASALLTAVLQEPNLRISIHALSALGTLRVLDSVDAISEFAVHQPPEVLRYAIEAARKIGGRKAAAWLFTLSSGYDDARVCDAAKLALNDVEKRMNSL